MLCELPELVNYGHSYMWSKWWVWIKYVSKWVYGSISSNYVKRNVEKKCKFVHGVIFVYFGLNKVA